MSSAPSINWRPSPNFGPRDASITHIILHTTEMPTAEAAMGRLCDPTAQVSAHYLIDEGGATTQLVQDKDRAYHAGLSRWHDHGPSLNATSIGIELAHPGPDHGHHSFPAPQISALLSLLDILVPRHQIRRENILAHSDIAPARKRDPGAYFPWAELAHHGYGLWPAKDHSPLRGTPVDPAALTDALHRFGYRWGEQWGPNREDVTILTDVLIAAQRHFRPSVMDGVGDFELLAILEELLGQRAL